MNFHASPSAGNGKHKGVVATRVPYYIYTSILFPYIFINTLPLCPPEHTFFTFSPFSLFHFFTFSPFSLFHFFHPFHFFTFFTLFTFSLFHFFTFSLSSAFPYPSTAASRRSPACAPHAAPTSSRRSRARMATQPPLAWRPEKHRNSSACTVGLSRHTQEKSLDWSILLEWYSKGAVQFLLDWYSEGAVPPTVTHTCQKRHS